MKHITDAVAVALQMAVYEGGDETTLRRLAERLAADFTEAVPFFNPQAFLHIVTRAEVEDDSAGDGWDYRLPERYRD